MPLIVAIDDPALSAARSLVRELCSVVDGFKIGLPFLLYNGAGAMQSIHSDCRDVFWIADLKLADIGYVMRLTASLVIDYVDAVIAHGFLGVRGALDELKDYLDEKGRKLAIVVSMSHPGSGDVYDKALPEVMSVAERLKPWGIVAPATRPQIIRQVRARLGSKVEILAPGVGAQGARPGEALCAGANYEIVGRIITNSENPVEAARRVLAEQRKMISSCQSTKATTG